nr:SpaA isopeptide-forming pilin-related protein [uncultured Blautia sp.]
MKKEKNRKVKKGAGGWKHSWQYRAISLMCVILLVCSTVILDTGLSRANSFDDEISLDTENVDVVENAAETGSTEEYPQEISQDSSEVNVDFEDDFTDTPAETVQEENLEAAEEAADFSAGDDEETAQPETVTYTKLINNDTVEVKAEADAGTLPDGAVLNVTPVEKETEQYTAVENVLTSLAQNKETKLDGFLAYNVSFTDSEGNPVEPNGTVQYSFQYTEPVSPELADPANTSVTAVKIRKNTETSEMEFIELNAEDHKLAFEMNESRQLQKAEFQSADTATVAFAWNSKETAQAEDNNGEEQNQEPQPNETPDQNTEQTPEQAPIGTIEITADEVNLRTAPSTEAEVIATANTGTQLPLLETVTAEDGSNWYKVTYDGTIVYVRSDMAAVVGENQEEEIIEEPTEEEEELTTEESNTLTFTKTVNDVVVTAVTDVGVIPENAEFVVTPVEKETEQYTEVENRLQEQVQNENQELCGFLAYDIYFIDIEGNKIEPAGDVKVSMEYSQAAIPEEVANSVSVQSEDEDTVSTEQTTNVEVMHFVEDETGTVQNIVNMTQQGLANVETTVDGEVQKAEFNTESFSVFTITWKRTDSNPNYEFNFSKNIYMVKKNGTSYTGLNNTVSNGTLTLETEDTNPVLYTSTITSKGVNSQLYSVKETDNTIYRFEGAYLATGNNSYTLVNNNKIIKLMGKKGASSNTGVMKYQYKGDTSYREITGNQKVIFVYTNAALTTVANMVSENGVTLYAGSWRNPYSTVDLKDLTGVLDVAPTPSVNSPIPSTARENSGGNDTNNDYGYVRTVVGSGDEAVEVKYLKKGDEGLQYSEDNQNWIDVGSNPVKFVYRSNAGDKKTIDTADTKGLIDINLANYRENKNYKGIYPFNGTDWTGSEKVTPDLVKSDLQNGYPVLKNGNTSLDELFNGTWSETIKYASGLNHLFKYDATTGTYTYDSDSNYAYYDASARNTEKNFIVYDKSYYRYSAGFHGGGAFMPFAALDDNDTNNGYAFGMTVSFDFMQPKDGQINGKNMVFEFSGDDDVWVFIDGKLVLDLGGVHNMATGSINFATGEVKVNTKSSTTLNNIFGKSRFGDYSSHTLNFFYLERGRGESNCSLKFNLPPMPTNSIEIAKSLDENNKDIEKYTSTEFEFKAYLEDKEENGQFSAIAAGTPYRVKKNGKLTQETRYVEKGNIFKLKAGESAVFEGIESGLKFYAEEVGIKSDQFDRVDITGWKVSYIKDGEVIGSSQNTDTKIEDGQYLARSETKTAGEAAKVEFINTCAGKNLRELHITKKIKEGTIEDTSKETFSFRVWLSGQNGELIPYDGAYTVKEGDNVIGTGNASLDGKISGIKQNQTVVIGKILSGTQFKVEEVDLDSKYSTPKKELVKDTFKETETDADGELILEKDAEVIITNVLKVNMEIQKIWEGDNKDAKHSSIYVGLYSADEKPIKYLKLNEDNNFKGSFSDVRADDKVYELRPVSEGDEKEFEIGENNFYVKVIEENVVIATADEVSTKYNVSYKTDANGSTIKQTITNTKITADLKLLKVEKGQTTGLSGAEFALYKAVEDASGNLKTGDPVQNKNIITDINGKATASGLIPGKYILKEIKAPTGYVLSTSEWIVEVSDTKTVTVMLNGNTLAVNGEGEYVIENTKIYSLPSAGGSGTYGFTISGVAILTAALLLFIKNKRKEDEACRSTH